jgi:transcription initiation factor TFIIIB Brf1 subunit/transcription initiation factor TFIIB
MTDTNYDDEWDACANCGGDEFDANEREWERVCMKCGRTSAFELFNYTKPPPDYFYKHENCQRYLKGGEHSSH